MLSRDHSTNGSPALDISAWRSAHRSAPPLSLIVREISSVSATFILSFSIAEVDRDIASLVHAAEDDNDLDATNENDSGNKTSKKRLSFISEIFAKELFSVNVNGSPWQRVFIRVADNGDEAVIIIYGLLPGRQYDIDLGLVQDGQSSTIRSHFTTEDQNHPETLHSCTKSEVDAFDCASAFPSSDHHPRGPSHCITPSTSSSSSFASESESSHTSHNDSSRVASSSTSSDALSPNRVTISTEEHVSQLQHTLDMLITERDTLTANLKSVRRESQKADAALRAEIETLKRSSEKHTVAEQRAKQKILALQEAHKRATAAAQETEEEVREMEAQLPNLMQKKEEKEKEYERIEVEAAKVRKEREQIEDVERKQIEGMKAESAVLSHKLEKLGGKREKLETGTIPDLEKQLQEVAEEIETIEVEERELEQAFANGDSYHNQMAVDEMGKLQQSRTTLESLVRQPQQQRARHNSFHGGPPPGAIGRQPIGSSGRSSNLQASSILTTHPHVHQQPQQLWNTAPPRQSQSQWQQSHPRTFTYPQSNSLPHIRVLSQPPPLLINNPQRKSTTLKSSSVSSPYQLHGSPTSFTPPSPGNSSSAASSPAPGFANPAPEAVQMPSIASSSTLSSRAPAFEPSLGLGILSKGGQFQRSNYGSPSPTSTGTSTSLRSCGSGVGGKLFWNAVGEPETGSR
ncbi:hypothetical protein AX15_007953 [Amanita polypyramis BW_CC]|nr:hypothetical protein AX15_007953 [Amanita polypyramis BW_CC]